MVDVTLKPNDRELLWIAPQSDDDERVPTAEELRDNSKIAMQQLESSRARISPAGLLARPTFTPAVGSKGLTIGALAPYSPKHPLIAATPSTALTLPALADTVSSVSRYDRIYLLCFSAIVDADIDPDIIITFDWRNQTNALQNTTKENTRRIRDFYAFVWSNGVATESALYAALATNGDGDKTLTVSKVITGAALGSYRIYPLDANLVDGKTYVVQNSLELIELTRVWRVQNTNQSGYVWGRNGEKDFEADFHIQPSYRYVGVDYQNWQSRAHETLYRVLRGLPVGDTPTGDRSVQNLVNGQVGANLDAPGIATASPNGSTALANEQRVTFTNTAITQTLFAQPVVTTDSGGGVAQAQINFAGNSPAGSSFAGSGHKVFTAAGVDVSASGSFTGGGGTGALTWTESGSPVTPGDTVYMVPAISYPAGSGFPVASRSVEKVFFNNAALNAANVLDFTADLSAYATPAGGESHIAVLDKGRAGLRYIYKKYTASTNGSGVLVMPSGARGLIAFIEGQSGRKDLPVVTGLSASTSYNFLCYHAPPGSEQWQFQFKAARYAGTNETLWLDDARVVTNPIAIAHCQIGGNATSNADRLIRDEAIGFRLPYNNASGNTGAYTFNTTISFDGEASPGALSFREIFHEAAGFNYAALRPGQVLNVTAAVSVQSQGMSVALDTDSIPLGIYKRPLASDLGYQLVLACVVEKGGEHRLLIITMDEGTPAAFSAVKLDSDSPHFAGIDLFKLY